MNQLKRVQINTENLLDANAKTFVHPLGVEKRKNLFALTDETENISPILSVMKKVN
jgi:hypothetical protein